MGLWESVTIGTKIGGIEGALLRDGDKLYRIPRVRSWVLHLRIRDCRRFLRPPPVFERHDGGNLNPVDSSQSPLQGANPTFVQLRFVRIDLLQFFVTFQGRLSRAELSGALDAWRVLGSRLLLNVHTVIIATDAA